MGIGQHWLEVAHERIIAGEGELEVMLDYGYISSRSPALLLSLEHVTSCGQIQEGDKLAILDNRGEVHIETAKVIIRSGNTNKTDGEEIVLRKARNIYFITDLYLDDKSWVKECHILKAQ